MLPLIDGDILLHELGWSSEFKDKELDPETGEPSGKVILFDWEKVSGMLTDKINLICDEVDATEPPLIFISDTEHLSKKLGREFIPNFRYEVAVTKPYKGTRKNPKPFHFYNILAHLLFHYNCLISKGGLEADDEMAIYQHGREDTIICSRDKDLRICDGWHYSWECGGQRSIGPTKTDTLGWLETKDDGSTLGYGLAFYYYQMLTGDAADNIGGLSRCGDVGARKILEGCTTEGDYFNAVKEAYKKKLGDESRATFLEMAQLLWIRQERDKAYGF